MKLLVVHAIQLAFLASGPIVPVILDVIAWRRLRSATRIPVQPVKWRLRIGYAALGTSASAYIIPVGSILYNFALYSTSPQANSDIDIVAAIEASLVIALSSIVLGFISPKGIRILVILSAALVILFGLSIFALPHGV